jgi:hypothetical protein
MFLKKLFSREGSAKSASSGDGGNGGEEDKTAHVFVRCEDSADNAFNKVPRDVLAMILSLCLAAEQDPKKEQGSTLAPPPPPPPPPSESASALLAVEREAVRAVNKRVQSLALVSRCFSRAAATDVVVRRALEVAGLHVPTRVWYGGSLQGVFRAQWALKLEQGRHQEKQDEALARPFYAVPCGIGPPPRQGPPVQMHPRETASFHQFAGLNDEEAARVQLRAQQLVNFLRSFSVFSAKFDAESALQRYRMFLELRQEHPNTLLLPTADILFAQLAHVFRTAAYHEDVKSGVVMASDVLQLNKDEEAFYNQAARGTAKLWKETFGLDYFAEDSAKEHAFFAHQERPMGNAWRQVPYQAPVSYVAAVGPRPKSSNVALPAVRLTASDLINDLKWMPELERSFSTLLGEAAGKLGMRNWTSEKVVAHLFKGYQRFLFLCKTRQDLANALAPPVAIDWLWHAHQSTPLLYAEETTRVVGSRLDHDPWPTEKKDFRPLSDEFKCAWKTAFGTTIEDDHWFQ